ncbi:MAG: M55 family metallopeptidase [Planctomycetota bacterium]|nr:M55 family metallopeptidase [Planctomycetota bacterium]
MKVYISADLEGVCGVVHRDQTGEEGKDYEKVRRWMTAEVNSAIEGALAAGARKILVNDSHGDMRNILPDELHPKALLISGSLKPLSMMEGISREFDCVFFVGYHAAMGTRSAILDHSYYGQVVSEVKVNGRMVGEVGLNALVAGAFGVPVTLVTGDRGAVVQARGLLGPIETVAVKEATTRYAARSIHPSEAHRLIRDAASRAVALSARIKPFRLKPPFRLTMRFINSGMADGAAILPRTKRLDGTTTEYVAKDPIEMFQAMQVWVTLGASTIPIRR